VSPADMQRSFSGCAALAEAGVTDISFLGNTRYLGDAKLTKAGAVFVAKEHSEPLGEAVLIAVGNPSKAFDAALKEFAPPASPFVPGIHPSAVIASDAKVDPTKVCVGAHVVVESGASIGEGTTLAAFVYVGAGARIGEGCFLLPRSSVLHGCVLGDRVRLQPGVVIGGDGFGYEFINGRHEKIDQLGIVEIGDDVEIGANSTIDRARFSKTVIGEGTKIDNQVQIAHGVEMGRHCIVVAQVGIAGSTKIGDYTVVAAQAGIAGHLEIAPKTIIAARSGVTKSIETPGQYMGFPAVPARESREIMVLNRKLPDLYERVKLLEQQLASAQPEKPASA
jgi:UDP-3-O-[3-hydroxymyristoyl] glucosamine N-acyltransferase